MSALGTIRHAGTAPTSAVPQLFTRTTRDVDDEFTQAFVLRNETPSAEIPYVRRELSGYVWTAALAFSGAAFSVAADWPAFAALALTLAAGSGSMAVTAGLRVWSRGRL